jgi:flavin reductase (DIM6/NTAB) family NADH-FMN oxidoreductase RutF
LERIARKTFTSLDHKCVALLTTANTDGQRQVPEAAAVWNMGLEPHWLVAAAVLEKRKLQPAVLQAGCCMSAALLPQKLLG